MKEQIPELTAEQRTRARIAYWVTFAALLLFAGGGGYLVALESRPARAARPIEGRIEHVDFIKHDDGHGNVSVRPIVIYSYSVGEVRYTTDRIGSLGHPLQARDSVEIRRRYQAGQPVTAYVVPLDPGSAFLVQDHDWKAYSFLFVPLAGALGLAAYWPASGLKG